MFDRENPLKILMVTLIGLILLYFASIGIAKFIETHKPDYYIGEIFGRKIPRNSFEDVKKHARILSVLRFGKSFYELENFLDLDNQAWDKIMLLEEAKQHKIKITDQDVVNTIYQIFSARSKFDMKLYRQVVRDTFKTDIHDFEESIRESLILEKLNNEITSGVSIEQRNLFEEYRKKNDKFEISYVLIPAKNYLDKASATEEEIQTYFVGHKEEFTIPPTINIEYVKLDFPPDGGVQKEVEMKFKAQAICDDFHKNQKADLKTFAPKYHQEAKTSGFFSKNNPLPDIEWSFELLRDTFKMRPNQISEPIELKKGYLVIRLKEKRDSYIPELVEVHDKVKEAVLLDKAKILAKEAATQYLAQITNDLAQVQKSKGQKTTFNQVAEKLSLKTKDSPSFTLEQSLDEIGTSEEFETNIFKLTPETPSTIAQIPDGSVIVYLKNHEAVTEAQFTKEKNKFIQLLTDEKKDKIYLDFVNGLKKKAGLKIF